MKAKTLYLIGNGFDIQHEIPANYWDFREFLIANHEEFIRQMEELYSIQPLDDTEPWYRPEMEHWNERIKENLWWNFEHDIGFPDVDSMMSLSSSAAEGLNRKYGAFLTESTMNAYWREQYGFMGKFQQYVKEWVSSLNLDVVIPIKNELVNNQNDLFLTFNYSNTLEKVYHIPSYNILHIHGGIAPYCACPPIMGHGQRKMISKYRQYASENHNHGDGEGASICNAIANYYQVTLKDTKRIIFNHLDYFKSLNHIQNVNVIGLSLGSVDFPYLVEVKKSVRRDASWNVYYHGETAHESMKIVLEQARFKKVDSILKPSSIFWKQGTENTS